MVASRAATRGTAFVASAIVAMIALLAPRADALKIDFPPDGKECITEMSAAAGDTFSGSFMLIEDGARLSRWDGVFDLTVRDESRYVVYTARHTSEHRFEFNSEKAGAHEFCFTNLKSRPVTLFYNAAVGHHWSHDAATHSHLSDLERALQSLRQVTGEVKVEVRYQKAREVTQRRTSETINGRVFGYSMLESLALVGTALFQANYVKRMFSQKTRGGGTMTGV